ncbi:MAG TPA: pyridoxal 5'-phosphate synthase glutaminase subunit PdxT [Actinomycetota bacterium]|nr:pyridoxal 5'-phosphate synthase glutaminase subunit PdxT [Actinomycetota bacterium]
MVKVGVLALQGDVSEHLDLIRGSGAAVPVRTAADLDTVDAVVLPGGESTTIAGLLERGEMMAPLRKAIASGMPAFGTCAGAIVLASEVRGGDVPHLGVLDMVVQRNAYGRQVDSFETRVDVASVGEVDAVFIRAPVIEEVGTDVDVLATHDGRPVVVRQGRVLAATFHPEIAGDPGLHRYFLEQVCGA